MTFEHLKCPCTQNSLLMSLNGVFLDTCILELDKISNVKIDLSHNFFGINIVKLSTSSKYWKTIAIETFQ